MIYLKDANIIFLKARKVAGTSFEIALSKFANQDDIITPVTPNDEKARSELGFPGAQNYLKPIAEFDAADVYRTVRYRSYPKKFNNHLSALEARKRLGPEVFDNAYKIAIVRNPYDTLVSSYFFAMNSSEHKISFTDWIKENPHVLNRNSHQYEINGKNIIDYFIRFENIIDDTEELEAKKESLRGLSVLVSSIRTKDGIRPKKNTTPAEVFNNDADLISAVRFFNKDIIDRFDYSLD
ncbi:sulfotransferase family 2 domain-containing protein [Pelagimonas varians]|uniref:Sulfotransferase family protein n=1 Tax=Pelagimonas varians TaxID=696760 RepID=A0A238L5R2_9RHOB|nr:sulfotransferase family 2 domain-containing protein [Pelagimonas varians]PYG25480.1 sulfotransferase family protein [Pelagimonas varians]SMX50339.1 hypothetical protein PEV8663_04596 [Pelagimonas varians]